MNISSNNEKFTSVAIQKIPTGFNFLKNKITEYFNPAAHGESVEKEFQQNQADVIEVIDSTFRRLKQIKDSINYCHTQAESSLEKAKEAADIPVGFFCRTTPALERLQTASISLAKTQLQTTEAQKLLFEQQLVTAKAVESLFKLSVGNIAITRLVVNEIKLRLQKASEQNISSEAQEELKKLLQQLVQQLDQMEQIEKLKARITSLESNQRLLEEQNETIKNRTHQNINFAIALSEKAQTITWE